MVNTIVLGFKKRIHIEAAPLDQAIYDQIEEEEQSDNDKLKRLASEIDKKIYSHYKLWPSNYIAYDLYNKTTRYKDRYDEKELRHFERRLERRVNTKNQLESFFVLIDY